MAKFVYIYTGGQMAETPEAQQEVMAAWGAWFGELGGALTDGGNPFGASVSVRPDGAVSRRLPSVPGRYIASPAIAAWAASHQPASGAGVPSGSSDARIIIDGAQMTLRVNSAPRASPTGRGSPRDA